MHYQTFDRFYKKAAHLRAVYDGNFSDPLQTQPERFQWDYWHVPGEYTVLRTPAYHYFPQEIYEPFHRYLVNWGRTHLGCHDISPPWLSCYVEGCRQEPHQDQPHGPLAFVFSLTDWSKRKFRGGETFIVKPKSLIAPEFNRLTIFNPALTHGVREVRGTHDPRLGRLVIHGWFVNPRPFWEGPLKVEDVRAALDDQLASQIDPRWKLGQGLLSLRLTVSARGKVQKCQILANTLMNATPTDVQKMLRLANSLVFPKRPGTTRVTVPLMVTP